MNRSLYTCLLALIALTAIVGKVVLAWHGINTDDGIIAIGAGAVGALATLALVGAVETPAEAEVDAWLIEEEVRRELHRQQTAEIDSRKITPRDDTGTWPPDSPTSVS